MMLTSYIAGAPLITVAPTCAGVPEGLVFQGGLFARLSCRGHDGESLVALGARLQQYWTDGS
jgi:hypothetical protein